MSVNVSHFFLRYGLLATIWLGLSVAAAGVQASVFDKLIGQSDGPINVEDAYRFSAREVQPGLIELNWQIEEGYYLYRDRIILSTDGTTEVVADRRGPAKDKEDAIYGRTKVYYSEAQVFATLRSLQDAPADGTLSVEYQGCWEGGICYPPVTKQVALKQVPLQAAVLPGSAGAGDAALPGGGGAAETATLSEQDAFARALKGDDLAVTLLLFFVAGLGLALTPCVFPMIPILSSVIAGQGTSVSTGRAFALSLVYVLSMSLTYTGAGVVAGLFGENLQAAFQNPWIIGSFSGLFVLLAFAMFGFYELQMPSAIQNRLGNMSRGQHGGQVLGVAVMGLLSALIVGPCVAAPLAGALIYIGQTGDPLLGGLALFTLSMGMGAPLLLVGTSAGKLLPKAGPWMAQIKSGFGVIMLLMAVWMLDRIVAPEVTMVLAGIILVVSAIFLRALDSLPQDAGSGSRLAKGVGILLLIYGGSLLLGAAAGNRSLVYPLQGLMVAGGEGTGGRGVVAPEELPFVEVSSPEQLEAVLASAKADGRPALLDFYADWCVSCKEIEFFLFAEADVQKEFERFTLVRVDVTANDEAAKELNRRYQLIGPPALIFYDVSGAERKEMTLIGVPETRDFVERLQRI